MHTCEILRPIKSHLLENGHTKCGVLRMKTKITDFEEMAGFTGFKWTVGHQVTDDSMVEDKILDCKAKIVIKRKMIFKNLDKKAKNITIGSSEPSNIVEQVKYSQRLSASC